MMTDEAYRQEVLKKRQEHKKLMIELKKYEERNAD